MLDTEKFLTVHDLKLSWDEYQVWGGLSRTPDTYPTVDGLTAQDTALTHMVIVCVDRQDFDDALRYADAIQDLSIKELRLAFIEWRMRGEA